MLTAFSILCLCSLLAAAADKRLVVVKYSMTSVILLQRVHKATP